MEVRRGWGVALAGVATMVAAPSAAQDPPAMPIVRIASVSPVIVTYSCGDIDPGLASGEVVLTRTGDLVDGLAVTFETTDTSDPPSPITFEPTEGTASIFVGFGSFVPSGPIVVTLVDGDSYDLGEPATATVLVDDSAVERGCPPYEPPPPPEPPVVEPTFTG